jgi:hypothetical protein
MAATQELADLLLTHETHLKQHGKQPVMQASLIEHLLQFLACKQVLLHLIAMVHAAQAQMRGLLSAPAQRLQLGQGNRDSCPDSCICRVGQAAQGLQSPFWP